MDLSIYDIIRKPRITSKSYILNNKLGQLVVEVHPKANKPLVAEALKKLFNVEVEKVRIVVLKGKVRRAGRHFTKDSLRKKAIVTLKNGQTIDLVGWSQSAQAQPSAAPVE